MGRVMSDRLPASQDLDQPTACKPRRKVEIDWDRYMAMLDDDDLSDAEKQQFLEALWQIIVQFVDLGFGVHPLQSVHTSVDTASKTLETALADMVSSDASSKPMFDSAVRESRKPAGERRESCSDRKTTVQPARKP
ncbi:hypothetical protein [Oceaniradius stylonematis]|uniref:hypothetical protein n=1 Tax=Oceaniradius stylonematis TaxID=2184161 RepID=UPI00273E1D77|nr:hypothetical protein [Oceaniradius stylonematis]